MDTPKKIDVFQCELNDYKAMEVSFYAKFVGKNKLESDEVTFGNIYPVIEDDNGMYRVVDDSEEDYLYLINDPNDNSPRWEIIEIKGGK